MTGIVYRLLSQDRGQPFPVFFESYGTGIALAFQFLGFGLLCFKDCYRHVLLSGVVPDARIVPDSVPCGEQHESHHSPRYEAQRA